MKKSDPVYDLAENIVNSINRISSAKVQKAGFDQTYKTTILGINRTFVDIVPASKQSEIIKDYGIPEDDTNLGYSFYTFVMDRVYYVVKSTGNFKLYEEVIVRVPNGNWSDMFIEVTQGGDFYLPKVFKSVTEPMPQDYQIHIGDYWIQLDSTETNNIVAFWEYKHNDEQEIDEWDCMFNVNSGSGSLTVNIEHAIIVQRDDII